MFIRFRPATAALFLSLALPVAAQQAAAQHTTAPQSAAPQAITVQNPWARASAGQAANGAAYLTLTGTTANRLLSASSPVAEKVELHEVINDGGVMKMRAVPGIAVAPDKPTTLAPGGLHIMLLGLRQPLRQGDSFPLTLTFADGPLVTVQVPVQGVGAMGSGGMGSGSPHGAHRQ